MKYADPEACPDCRRPIAGEPTCPHCGFGLDSAEARQLWSLFLQADRLVAADRMRREQRAREEQWREDRAIEQRRRDEERRAAASRPAPVPTAAPAVTAPTVAASSTADAIPVARVARHWSTGSVLLGLGALCLIVAGVIFVTITWGSLGLLGRAAVLLAVTAMIAGLAAWASRRRLKATTEALWTVFLGLLSVDWLAACSQGLAGLDALDTGWAMTLWTALVLAASVGIVRRGRADLEADLIAPQVVTAIAAWATAPVVARSVGRFVDDRTTSQPWFWGATAATVLVGAVLAVVHRGGHRVAWWPTLVLAGLWSVVTTTLALVAAGPWEAPLDVLDVVPLGVLSVAAITVAGRFGRLRPWAAAFVTAAAGWALAAEVFGLLYESDRPVEGTWSALALYGAVLAAASIRPGDWVRGVRWTVAAIGAVVGVVLVVHIGTQMWRVGEAALAEPRFDAAPSMRLMDWWPLALLASVFALGLVILRWWRSSPAADPRFWLTLLVPTLVGGVTAAVGVSDAPFAVHAVVVVVAGVATAWVGRAPAMPFAAVWPPLGGAIVGFAAVVVPVGGWVTVVTWSTVAAGLVAVGFAARGTAPLPSATRVVAAALTTIAVVAAIVQAISLSDLRDDAGAVLALLVVVLTPVFGLALRPRCSPWHGVRLGIDVAALVLIVPAVGAAVERVQVDSWFAVVVWLEVAAAAALIMLGTSLTEPLWRAVSATAAALATGLALGAVGAALSAAGVDDEPWPVLLGLAALAAGAGAAVALSRWPWHRLAVAAAAGVVYVLVLAHALDVVPADSGLVPILWLETAGAWAIATWVVPRSTTEGLLVSAAASGLSAGCAIGAAVAVIDLLDLAPGWPGIAAAAVPLMLAAATQALGRWPRHRIAIQLAAAVTFAGLAVGALADAPTGSPLVALVWLEVAGAFGIAVWLIPRTPVLDWISAAATGGAVASALAAFTALVDSADPGPGWWGALLASAAAAVLLVAMALDDLPRHRIVVEIVAALAFLVALGHESAHLGAVSLILTVGAAATAIVGVLDQDRDVLRWVAGALTGAAWVTRLAASDVTTVEAYTVPFAVAVLAAGVWRMRSDPRIRSWLALGPGLTLALLPSLPQALDDPTSLRALLLGVAAAVAVAAGVVLRWNAPLLAGAGVLALVVLWNVGPEVVALQRWILIAIAGSVLLFVGATWEKRVADGRAVLVRIAALR